jgi:hypothetical protein
MPINKLGGEFMISNIRLKSDMKTLGILRKRRTNSTNQIENVKRIEKGSKYTHDLFTNISLSQDNYYDHQNHLNELILDLYKHESALEKEDFLKTESLINKVKDFVQNYNELIMIISKIDKLFKTDNFNKLMLLKSKWESCLMNIGIYFDNEYFIKESYEELKVADKNMIQKIMFGEDSFSQNFLQYIKDLKIQLGEYKDNYHFYSSGFILDKKI